MLFLTVIILKCSLCELAALEQTGFPNTSCHWSDKKTASPPNSHHWLSQCFYVKLVGILKQTPIF